MSNEKIIKPQIRLLAPKNMYTVEVCSPIKEQINRIKVCQPNIVVKPCNPVEQITCIPDISCSPLFGCYPDIGPCSPMTCFPAVGTCLPTIGCSPTFGCSPTVGPCGPWVEVDIPKIDEIKVQVEKLTEEINILKQQIAKR